MLLFSLFVGAVLLALTVPILISAKGRRSLLLALRSLWLHKLRSFLSVLGIIIGTGAVIAQMGFGEGSMHEALEDIKRMGATNIMVRSVKPADDSSSQKRSFVATYGITYADYERFTTLAEQGVVTRMVPMRYFPQEIRRREKMFQGRLVATTPAYTDVNQLEMSSGRFLTDEDEVGLSNVVVLGSTVTQKLFPFENPLGETIKLGNYYYVVIGVVEPRLALSSPGGSQGQNFNEDVYIPLSTCRARYGEKIYIRQSGSRSGEKVDFHQVTLTVADTDLVRPTGEVLRGLMEQRHLKTDWALDVPLDKLEAAEREQTRYLLLLVMIAGISLLVGGIGIMNIMLATVTERTREIGIRRALGAKQRDITMQFLIEAVVQTSVGGLLGTALGLTVLFGIPPLWQALWEQHVAARVSITSIFLALAVSVSVGVGFGWYPARRASLLDPIEALRHE